MLTVVKRNKNPKKRRLAIYDGKKIITYVDRFWGWYAFTERLDIELHDKCRCLVMENLYWLLGNDCEWGDWVESVDEWDNGRHIYNVPVNELPPSMFFEGEKEIALNSFYN